ncbi:MAG: electron transfer flavoprotein subunit beta/FixA family protein [Deltaproteobacteria bacterium]|nr:electron transfer flavoprotein subunit beta/FixA family protein [Deltaproteobacteria bacterium]
MKIVVLVKQTPDTETKPKITADKKRLEEGEIKFVMNPYDEFAVEEALKTKEKIGGDSTVTVISLGPDRVVETIRTALAMGADTGIHISDPALDSADSYATAVALAAAAKKAGFDVIFCGKQAIDGDFAQVNSRVAETLDIPQINLTTKLDLSATGGKAERRIEGGEELIEFPLPALISCEKGLNEPRYASLPGIMKAKKKPLDKHDLAALGLSADAVKPRLQIQEIRIPEQKRRGVKLTGEVTETVPKLVKLLREEAKVI